MTARLLVVDDDRDRAEMIVRGLSRHFDCEAVATPDQALRAIAGGGWAAALVDFDLKTEGTGFLVLRGLRMLSERTVRVLYSSYYSDALAQEATHSFHAHGALDARDPGFLACARRTLNELLATGLPGTAAAASSAGRTEDSRWCPVSPVTRRFLEALRAAAESDAAVFIHGGPGSGKHLAAETLRHHREAWRRRHRTGPTAEDRAVRILEVPALRDRREDIPGLCAAFLARDAAESTQPLKRATPELLASFAQRDWAGNVRELHTVLYRAARHGRTRAEITPRDVAGGIEPAPTALQLGKDEGLRDTLLIQLRTAGSVRSAAALAGIPRPNFKRLMDRHGILRADWPPPANDPREVD